MSEIIIFLNSHRAKSGIVNGVRLSPAYILAAKFFDCGIIDRTGSLALDFPVEIVDPIPPIDIAKEYSFEEICDHRGKEIAYEAISQNKCIQLLWSGGIDSTTALISIMKHLPEEYGHLLEVLLNMDSIDEYPTFFRQHILNKVAYTIISAPIDSFIHPDSLIVTGEHGDQLFGSDKLLPLIKNELAFEDYEIVLPIFLMDKFGQSEKVDQLMAYLAPLIKACPFRITFTHELFWWLNFTLKWQQVALRLPVFSFRSEIKGLYLQFRHFFNSERFQQWALQHKEPKLQRDSHSYKLPAKKYIHTFTKDDTYFFQKIKQPSLREIIINRKNQGHKRYRVVMKADYIPQFEVFHKTFKNQNISS